MITNNKLVLLFALTLVYVKVVAAEGSLLRWWSLLASSSGSSEETEATTHDRPVFKSTDRDINPMFQDFAGKDDFSTTGDIISKTTVTLPSDFVGDTMTKHDGYYNNKDARKLKKSKKGARVPTPPRAPTAPIPPTTHSPIVFISSSKSSKSSKKRNRKLNVN